MGMQDRLIGRLDGPLNNSEVGLDPPPHKEHRVTLAPFIIITTTTTTTTAFGGSRRGARAG